MADIFCLLCLKSPKCTTFNGKVSATVDLEEFLTYLDEDAKKPAVKQSDCCDTCLLIIRSACEVSHTIKRLEKELEWKLASLKGIMELAGGVESRMLDIHRHSREKKHDFDKLRQNLIDKCEVKGSQSKHVNAREVSKTDEDRNIFCPVTTKENKGSFTRNVVVAFKDKTGNCPHQEYLDVKEERKRKPKKNSDQPLKLNVYAKKAKMEHERKQDQLDGSKIVTRSSKLLPNGSGSCIPDRKVLCVTEPIKSWNLISVQNHGKAAKTFDVKVNLESGANVQSMKRTIVDDDNYKGNRKKEKTTVTNFSVRCN